MKLPVDYVYLVPLDFYGSLFLKIVFFRILQELILAVVTDWFSCWVLAVATDGNLDDQNSWKTIKYKN